MKVSLTIYMGGNGAMFRLPDSEDSESGFTFSPLFRTALLSISAFSKLEPNRAFAVGLWDYDMRWRSQETYWVENGLWETDEAYMARTRGRKA